MGQCGYEHFYNGSAYRLSQTWVMSCGMHDTRLVLPWRNPPCTSKPVFFVDFFFAFFFFPVFFFFLSAVKSSNLAFESGTNRVSAASLLWEPQCRVGQFGWFGTQRTPRSTGTVWLRKVGVYGILSYIVRSILSSWAFLPPPLLPLLHSFSSLICPDI